MSKIQVAIQHKNRLKQYQFNQVTYATAREYSAQSI